MKRALITGISGQDGSYLAEFLLKKGYQVHGIVRRHSVAENQSSRLNHLRNNGGLGHDTLHYGDTTDFASIARIIRTVLPDEIYNLAAQSHVKVASDVPLYTANADAIGVMNILEILRNGYNDTRLYQASTSEMFGNSIDADGFQREDTPMRPVSPYGASKLFAHNLCTHYRYAYKIPISCGILFNHTSERRGETFVEQKIVKGLAEIKYGKREFLELGNLAACRDIGYAPEYIEAMWLMLQNKPDDYVIATGKTTSIKDLIGLAQGALGTNIPIINSEGSKPKNYIVGDSYKYERAQELDVLRGDASRAANELGWKPKSSITEIIKKMSDYWDGESCQYGGMAQVS